MRGVGAVRGAVTTRIGPALFGCLYCACCCACSRPSLRCPSSAFIHLERFEFVLDTPCLALLLSLTSWVPCPPSFPAYWCCLLRSSTNSGYRKVLAQVCPWHGKRRSGPAQRGLVGFLGARFCAIPICTPLCIVCCAYSYVCVTCCASCNLRLVLEPFAP